MRPVADTDPVWLTPGVGSTDAGTLLRAMTDDLLALYDKKVAARRRHIDIREAQGYYMRIIAEQDLPQGSPEWLDWRKGGVGGSEVSTLYPGSRFATPTDLWEQKRGLAPEKESNPDMERGKLLEPKARAAYESLMGWTASPLCVVHDRWDYMRCSLDGIRDDRRLILEIKAPRLSGHQKAEKVADAADSQASFEALIPYYFAQVQYQLLLTGATQCHFVSYCEDPAAAAKFLLISLFPCMRTQKLIEKRVHWFWDHVRRGVPPSGNPPHLD